MCIGKYLCLLDFHTADLVKNGVYYGYDYFYSTCIYCNCEIYSKLGSNHWKKVK